MDQADILLRARGNPNLLRQLILRDIFGWGNPNPPNEDEEPLERFNLNEWSQRDCKLHLRFEKDDIPRLVGALDIPEEVETRSGHKATDTEAMSIFLKRLCYPNRLEDIKMYFNRSISALSEINTYVAEHFHHNFNHLLEDLESHNWLTEEKMEEYANAVAAKGAAVENCWAFIDGTIRPICRPSVNQRDYYSGHKRVHCVKYQSLVTPDGLTLSCMGAFQGRRHDAGIFRESGFYDQLEAKSIFPNRNFTIYGDQGYGVRELLLTPFAGNNLTPEQQLFNTSMSSVREAVEWSFGKIVAEFAFVDFKKNQKLLLQEVEQMYKAATILANCHSCLYGNETAQYFNMNIIDLETYLNGE